MTPGVDGLLGAAGTISIATAKVSFELRPYSFREGGIRDG